MSVIPVRIRSCDTEGCMEGVTAGIGILFSLSLVMLAFHVLTCICTTFYNQYVVGLRERVNHRVRLGVCHVFFFFFFLLPFVLFYFLLAAE